MMVRLQTIVSREVHPMKSAVVTVATFHAGLKENIIPATGPSSRSTCAPSTPTCATQVNAALRRIIYAEADASGAPQPLIEELYTFPRCYNDPVPPPTLISELQEVLGEDNVTPSPR